MAIELPHWPFVYGSPCSSGTLRTAPEDFKVDENLSFEPSGDGEHVFLQIQKTGENTEYIARLLARFADVRQRDVGYAGLKDRHAVTTQWFSVWLPGKSDPDWANLTSGAIKILQTIRHARKLKRGVLSGNRFEIVLRDWQGDQAETIERLERIKAGGIANYYGEQRFGHRGQNVNKALAMFAGEKTSREQRSLYLSAARSYLFNQVLAERVNAGTWNQGLPGETYLFDGSQSCFKSDVPDEGILNRLQARTIHPSGTLWGKGKDDVASEALAIEQAVFEQYPEIAAGLVASGLEKSRRALRVNVNDLTWQFLNSHTLKLAFTLPAGSYATALLREIAEY